MSVQRTIPLTPGSTVDSVRRVRALGRWVWVVGLAEFLGFAVPLTVASLWADQRWGIGVIVVAGAFEGAILATAQGWMIRREVPQLRLSEWVGVTALAAALSYALGMLPSASQAWWSSWPALAQVAVASSVGAVILLSIGVAQWSVMRRFLLHAWWWILGTAAAWIIGLGAFFAIAPPLWHEGQPLAVTWSIGIAAGVVMAVAMAAVTGVCWLLLITHQTAIRRHSETTMS